jgi:branched-chain amino acid transport system ATP-binding protein
VTLEVTDLHVGYGETKVLRGVSLTLESGAHVGLFGPNGHGKTTLLRTISGLLRPWSGSVTLDGREMSRGDARAMVAANVIHVPQGSSLFPRMSVEENLLLGAHRRESWHRRREGLDYVYDILPRLADRRQQQCKSLSGGERQMLAIGIGLMGRPKILMLDEPTLGLAPRIKEELAQRIRDLMQREMSLLLVDQDVEFLAALVTECHLLEGGEIRMSMDPNSAAEDSSVLEMYFGRLTR